MIVRLFMSVSVTNKNDTDLNKNDTDLNNLPESILEIANTFPNCNIGKIFISALLQSKQTKVNISQINQTFIC